MPKKTKDGRYRAKLTVGHYNDGRPVLKYISATTKRELEAEKIRIRQLYIDGLQDVNQDVLFGAYAKEWYETYKEPSIGFSSRTIYAGVMNKHIMPAFQDRQVKAIRSGELQQFLNDRAHMSKTEVRYLTSVLKNIFKRALVDGVIARDPTLALTKAYRPEKKKRALTDAEQKAVLYVAENHPDGLILSILFYTGLRRGEALGLQWQDIDFTKQWIHVLRDVDFKTESVGDLKNEESFRDIPLTPELQGTLEPRRGIGATFVIQAPVSHSHLCKATFERIWEGLQAAMLEAEPSIDKDELPSSKKRREKYEKERKGKKDRRGKAYKEPEPVYGSILTPHYFRHNYCSVLYNAGVDVLTAQKYLGHSDIRTTLAIYAHLSEKKKDEGAELVKAAFSKKVAEKLPDKKTPKLE